MESPEGNPRPTRIMRVALLTTFASSKKDPLGSVMERIHQAFLEAGLGEPVIHFDFGDTSTHAFRFQCGPRTKAASGVRTLRDDRFSHAGHSRGASDF